VTFADLVTRADRAVQDHLGGVAVTYEDEFGQVAEVMGLFDERYHRAGGGEAGVEQVGPAVFLRIEDLPVPLDADADESATQIRTEPLVTIGGRKYVVRERQADGLGGVHLFLHLRSAGGC